MEQSNVKYEINKLTRRDVDRCTACGYEDNIVLVAVETEKWCGRILRRLLNYCEFCRTAANGKVTYPIQVFSNNRRVK